MKIETSQTLLFIGDSITAAGRNLDLPGEGRDDAAYGGGYVLAIKSMLDAFYPGRRIRVINKGVPGHTVKDLANRWQRDVLDFGPDWLGVMIGINDVWRQFDSPLQPEKHVSPGVFEKTYRSLLAEVRPGLEGLVVAGPYVVDANKDDAMRVRMDEYAAISRNLAEEFDAVFVATQAVFDAYLKFYHPNQLCWDRIHVSASGHMLIARAWLDAVGFEWNRG